MDVLKDNSRSLYGEVEPSPPEQIDSTNGAADGASTADVLRETDEVLDRLDEVLDRVRSETA
jgi:hypothetical protein